MTAPPEQVDRTDYYPPLSTPEERQQQRLPPHNEDAEIGVLSACLLEDEAIDRVRPLVAVDDFYRQQHRAIFAAMLTLRDRRVTVDPITVCNELHIGEFDERREYIGFLLDAVPVTVNAVYHAKIVREKAARRRLIEKLTAATNELWSGKLEVHDIAVDLTTALTPVAVHSVGEGFVHVGDDLYSTLEDIESRKNGKVGQFAVPTGYPELDLAMGGGIERGELLIIAGVPGGSKTAAAMNIALNVISDPSDIRMGAAVVSAEMNRRKLHRRNLSTVAQVPFAAMRSGDLTPQEWNRLARAAVHMKTLPLWVDQTASPAVEDIVAKARALKAEHPEVALLIVDFIQLVQRALAKKNMRDENRALELTSISYSLKGMAKELDLAVIATCQVDAAGIGKREDKHPKLDDARWSQGMREAADLFALSYRPLMYAPDPTGMSLDTLELEFAKARDAEPFKAVLNWQGKYMRLTSAQREARFVTKQGRMM